MTIERALHDWLFRETPAVHKPDPKSWWDGEECDACGDPLFADAERDERGVQRCGHCLEMRPTSRLSAHHREEP